jgi:hypothetical protein
MWIAKSSTNRREQITSRELILKQLRVAQEGPWKLAGGASHRFVATRTLSPGRGGGTGATNDSVALPGLAASCIRYRWLAPPANFRDASGVRSANDSRKSGLFVTVCSWTKRLALHRSRCAIDYFSSTGILPVGPGGVSPADWSVAPWKLVGAGRDARPPHRRDACATMLKRH